MKNFKLRNSIFSILLMSLFFTSCKGQTSTSQTTNKNNSTMNTEQHPKIVRNFESNTQNVTCQFIDKDGNLWFSINGEGAYRYNGKSFTNITIKDGLSNNLVNAIIQDKLQGKRIKKQLKTRVKYKKLPTF